MKTKAKQAISNDTKIAALSDIMTSANRLEALCAKLQRETLDELDRVYMIELKRKQGSKSTRGSNVPA